MIEQRVLGVDPGSQIAGWGLVLVAGNRVTLGDSGVIRTPRSADFPQRLRFLYEQFCAVLDAVQPESVAVEAIFHAKHARSALQLGHARGVLLLAASQRDVPIHEYPPATVKKAVAGNGRADKGQVRKMVDLHLGTAIEGPEDQSDALAVAICHAHSGDHRSRLAALKRGSGSRKKLKVARSVGAKSSTGRGQ